MVFFEISVFLIAGLVLGSFSTAIIHRVPAGIPFAFKKNKEEKTSSPVRSCCPACEKVLGPADLIPVFSWLFSRGRCRHCGGKIPVFYPLVETAHAVLALLIYFSFGFTSHAFFIMAVLPFLMALLVIDLKHMILPDKLVLIVGVIGFIRLIVEGFITKSIDPALVGVNYILAAFVYAGLVWALGRMMSAFLRKDALGFGDVKFFAVAGLWLGMAKLAPFCVLSGVLGIILALLWQVFKKERIFPFGPALISALFILLLVRGSLFI